MVGHLLCMMQPRVQIQVRENIIKYGISPIRGPPFLCGSKQYASPHFVKSPCLQQLKLNLMRPQIFICKYLPSLGFEPWAASYTADDLPMCHQLPSLLHYILFLIFNFGRTVTTSENFSRLPD